MQQHVPLELLARDIPVRSGACYEISMASALYTIFSLPNSPVHIQNDPPQIATEFILPPRVSDIAPK